MQISLYDLQTDPAKYVEIANREVVYITQNGKNVAKLTGANEDKVASIKKLFGILPSDVDLEQSRLERLNG